VEPHLAGGHHTRPSTQLKPPTTCGSGLARDEPVDSGYLFVFKRQSRASPLPQKPRRNCRFNGCQVAAALRSPYEALSEP